MSGEISAFPAPTIEGDRGMTLRDWFAGQAIQAVTSSQSLVGMATADDIDKIARCAYQIADAMLAARKDA